MIRGITDEQRRLLDGVSAHLMKYLELALDAMQRDEAGAATSLGVSMQRLGAMHEALHAFMHTHNAERVCMTTPEHVYSAGSRLLYDITDDCYRLRSVDPDYVGHTLLRKFFP